MSTVGDNGDSFGLFQVRRPFHCVEPVFEQFRGDATAERGLLRRDPALLLRPEAGLAEHGLQARTACGTGAATCGASVGAWFSGRWWNDPARGYVREVKRRLKARTWRTRDFRAG